MNSIREQLADEKKAYRQARYPGDLAVDAMPKRTSSWWIGALGAVAAMLVVGFDLYTRSEPLAVSHARPPVAIVAKRSTPPIESLWTPPRVQTASMSDIGSIPSPGPMPSFPSFFSDTSKDQ